MENFKFLSGKIPDELYSLSHEVDVPIKFLTERDLQYYYLYFNRHLLVDVNILYNNKPIKYWLSKVTKEIVLGLPRPE